MGTARDDADEGGNGREPGRRGAIVPAASESGTAVAAAAARERFEAGDFRGARSGFERAFALGDNSRETIAALQALLADADDQAALAAILTTYLDRVGPELVPADRIEAATALFDATDLTRSGGASTAALRLLEAAAAGDETAWAPVLAPTRRAAIEAAFATPLATLERLEQEHFAPPSTGLPALAVARAEEIGFRHAAEPEVARAAERLLHAVGAREAAYRVEEARRAARAPRPARSPIGDAPVSPPALSGLVVVVVGGHPALRRLVRVDLGRSGLAALRELPSAWEATRSGRAVRDLLAGADVAVLVRRQLAHSTTEQVTAAASGLGVPVVVAATASTTAVRRAVFGFVVRRSSS